MFLFLILSVLGVNAANSPSGYFPSNEQLHPPYQAGINNIDAHFDTANKRKIVDVQSEMLQEAIPRIVTLSQETELVDIQPAIKNPTRDTEERLAKHIVHKLDAFQTVAILVDDTKEVHRQAEIYMRNILNWSSVHIDFLLMKFNTSGVTAVLSSSSENRHQFLNLLKWSKNQQFQQTSMLLAPDRLYGSVVFFAILKAVQILPRNSAILVFTDGQTQDEDLAQLAVQGMVEKNIQLFVVWGGLYPAKNQEKLLREAANLSGGQLFIENADRELSQLYNSAYLHNPDATQPKAVIAFHNNITGNQHIYFPIDSSVRCIHVSITSPVGSAYLISPQGFVLNVLNSTEVERFSEGSFGVHETEFGQYEVQLNTAGHVPTPIAGLWHLDIDLGAQNAQGCNVTVSVQTHLNVSLQIAHKYDVNASTPKGKKVLRVTLSENIRSIENITLINKRGLAINQVVPFMRNEKHKEPLMLAEDGISRINQEVDIDLDRLPREPFYLRISGEDKHGSTFSRITYLDRERVNYLVHPLSVEVGAGSELIVNSNQQAKIFFEVTNNRDQVMYVYFMCQDERSLLARMEPRASWLNPKQTVIVTVTTYVPNVASSDYRNLITFTASGPERAQKAAIMYVGTNRRVQDTEEPRMTHRYTSDCTDILIGKCEDGTWVIEVTAEDRESGLLQLTSNPKGLYFINPYVAGTKEPVVGLYGGSCCQSKIQLIAIDMMNNRRTYTADAYYATLSAGSIAAIVLGVLLFIILILALIFLCRTKCCKQKESVDLPTYRGPHGNTQTRY